MPIIYQDQINEATKIGVWHITEEEDFFVKTGCLQRHITHPHKRLQHLAGRYLLKQLYPEFPLPLILIAETRKPFLQDEAFHFSISHCGDYAAAIVSTANRVGTDIEIPTDKIEKIKHKFLSPYEEKMLLSAGENSIQMLTIAWSVKEAMFKWYGKGGVDFRKDLRINKLEQVAGVFIAECEIKKEIRRIVQVKSIFVAGNNLSILVT